MPADISPGHAANRDVISAEALLANPVFALCSKMEIARLLNYAVRHSIAPGQAIFKEGEEPGTVYWIEKGEVGLSRGEQALSNKQEGFVGLEGVVGYDRYTETAIANKETVLIGFPRSYLDSLAENNIKILKKFFSAYEHRHQRPEEAPAAAKKKSSGVAKKAASPYSAPLAWLLVMAAPLLIYYFGSRAGVDSKILYFSGIIIDAVLMWVFTLVPAFVPPLFSILMIILFDVATPKVALSGFSSGTFFMCLSIFGISALMIKSGLAYRLSLNMLLAVPARRSWYSFILFVLGVLLSLVVPSRNGRTAIAAPFLIELLGMIKAKKHDVRATQFIASALYGATLMSPIFLTGSSLNLVLYGMFDEQTRYTYQWLYWLLAASVPGLILFGGFLLLSALYFKAAGPAQIPKHVMREQKKVLGPMSSMEVVTLATIVALVVLIPTLKFHKVDIPWLMMTISTALLIFGMIGQKEFRNEIDWPILVFIGAVLAWTPVISLIGLDGIIANSLSGVAAFMKIHFYQFVGAFCLAVMVTRLVLPIAATTVVLATIALPIAMDAGMSPWPIAFILLMMAEATVFPYQDQLRLQIDGALAQQKMSDVSDDSKFFRFDLIMLALRVGVIYASIPFWEYLDVI